MPRTGRTSDPLKDSLDELARLADRLVDNLSDLPEAPPVGPPQRQTPQSRAALKQTLDELDKMLEGEVAPRPGSNVEVAGDKGSDIQDHLDSLFTPPPEPCEAAPPPKAAPAPTRARSAPAAVTRPAAAKPTPAPRATLRRPVDLGQAEELEGTVDSLFESRIEMPAAAARDDEPVMDALGVEAAGEIATEVRIDLDPVGSLEHVPDAPALTEELSTADDRSIEVILDDEPYEASPPDGAPDTFAPPEEPVEHAAPAAAPRRADPIAAALDPSIMIEPATSADSHRRARSRIWPWIVGAAIVALLAGGAFWFLAFRRGSSDPEVRSAGVMPAKVLPAAPSAVSAEPPALPPPRPAAAPPSKPAEQELVQPKSVELKPRPKLEVKPSPPSAAPVPPRANPAPLTPAPPAAASRPPASTKTQPAKAAPRAERLPAPQPRVTEIPRAAAIEPRKSPASLEPPAFIPTAPEPAPPPPPAPEVKAPEPVAAPKNPVFEPLVEIPAPAQVEPAAGAATLVPPVVLERQEPVPPPQVRKLQAPVTVVLSALVSERGRVVRVVVEQSAGDDGLEAAAIDALLRWTYRPATRDGQPERSWVTETFVFGP